MTGDPVGVLPAVQEVPEAQALPGHPGGGRTLQILELKLGPGLPTEALLVDLEVGV